MEDHERTCREYGWIPASEALETDTGPVVTLIRELMPIDHADIERHIHGCSPLFVSSMLGEICHATTWQDLAKERGYPVLEPELRIPEDLPTVVRLFLLDLRAWLADRGDAHTGGCRAFYSPAESRTRGFRVSDAVVCVIGHDGGGLARYFNLSYCAYKDFEDMRLFMELRGFWCECQTAAETYVYRL